MTKKIIIAIDAMGGENAPNKNIHGISLFIKKNLALNDYHFNLYGNEILIKKELDKYEINKEKITIFNTLSVVSDEETPMTAVKNSKNSSMWNSISAQTNNNADISLSAGNTGVLLVISRMILKTMENISRPALAGL